MNLDKNIVKGIGALFLIAMVSAIVGNLTIVSIAKQNNYLELIYANKLFIGSAGVLLLANSLAVAMIGVLSFPLIRYKSEILAKSYLTFRIMESIILIIGIVSLLVLIPLSNLLVESGGSNQSLYLLLSGLLLKTNWYAYLIGMIVLGLGGASFCVFLLKYKVVPKALSILGVVGYVVLCVTSIISVVGPKLGLYVTLPVFLFEVTFGVWLIVRGIDTKVLLSEKLA